MKGDEKMSSNKNTISLLIIFILIFSTTLLSYLLLEKNTSTVDDIPNVFATSSFGEITLKDIDKVGNVYLQEKYKALDDAQRYFAEDIVIQHEAKQNNMSAEEFMDKYTSVRLKVDEKDIEKKYNEFVKQYPKVTRKDVEKKLILDEKVNIRRQLVKELIKKYNVVYSADLIKKIEIPSNKLKVLSYGEPTAPIHVSVFSDFLCSHCNLFHQVLHDSIEKNPSLYYIEFRQFPVVNELSTVLAKYAFCVENEDFINFADILYKENKSINLGNIRKIVEKTTVITDEFESCVNSAFPTKALSIDKQLGISLSIQKTPTIFVNGVSTRASDFEETVNYMLSRKQ